LADSNTIFLEKKAYSKGSVTEQLIQTYIDDEFIFYSFLLQIVSVYAFYPILYLFKKQGRGGNKKSRLGSRRFDQTVVGAIMLMIFAHFLSEQKSLKQFSFIPLPSWHKLINVLLLIEQCSLVLYLGRVTNSVSKELQ